KPLRGERWLAGAEIRGLQDRAKHAFRCDRVFADVVAVTDHHAAEILRPWAIRSGVENDVPGVASAQLLRLRRKSQEPVDLTLAKSSIGFKAGSVTHRRSSLGFKPTCAAIRRSSTGDALKPTLLPFRSAALRMPSLANNSKQPIWVPPRTT